MYPAIHAQRHPERPAFIMASSGTETPYRELDAASNRLAHLLRSHGLRQCDHYSVFMENNRHYLIANAAGERSGLYYTCINSFLTAQELAYIVDNSDSQVLITSRAKRDIAAQALALCPQVRLALIVDAPSDATFLNLADGCAAFPATPIADERLGTPMLYSSGTTGRPKGVLRPLPDNPPSEPLPLFHFLNKLWRYREDMVYLSPAPLYHSAPQAAVSLCIRNGGTAVIMEHFDPEQYLAASRTASSCRRC
jgi:long-chain acyl-CoA synthetase